MTKQTQKQPPIRTLTLAALFAALTCALTMFPQIPILNGFVHMGDAIVYLGACFLPWPWASLAASVGAGLADVITGYAIWLPATLIIKAVTALLFRPAPDLQTKPQKRILSRHNLLMLPLAALVSFVGYFFAELLLFRDLEWQPIFWTRLGMSLLQSGSSTVLFLVAGTFLQRVLPSTNKT